MGNCLRSNRVMAQDPEPIHSHSPNLPATESKKLLEPVKQAGRSAMAKPRTGAKKVVRFKLQEDHENIPAGGGEEIGGAGADGGGGVLRIKVVVSQKELKQILKDGENNSCSVEELIAELKVKGRTSTISDATESRSPLKSPIPEDLQ